MVAHVTVASKASHGKLQLLLAVCRSRSVRPSEAHQIMGLFKKLGELSRPEAVAFSGTALL